MAFDGTNIWVADSQAQGMLVELNPGTGAVLASTLVGGAPYGVVFDGAYVWVTTETNVTQIQPSTAAILRRVSTPEASTGIAFDGANLWVSHYGGGYISKM